MTVSELTDICNYEIPRNFFDSFSQMETYIKLSHTQKESDFILTNGKGWIWQQATHFKDGFVYFPIVAREAIKLKFS